MENELIVMVEEDIESGYTAKALGYSIYTQADTLPELRKNVLDAVSCHFEDGEMPSIIRLHFVREEVLTHA